MGLRSWRGWDRFDALDRRVGLVSDDPDNPAQQARALRAFTYLLVPILVLFLISGIMVGNWLRPTVSAAFLIPALFIERRRIRRRRKP